MQTPGATDTVIEKYPPAMLILHWLIALMIICLLAVGLIMTGLSRDDPNRSLLFSLHKSFGLTVLLLAAIRLGWRLSSALPPLPALIPLYERCMAHVAHWVLYGFMFLMPVSGYVMSTSYGLPVHWFGVTLPRLVGVDKARGMLAGDIHSFAAYTLMVIIGLHVAGALKHYLFERINLFKRLW